jgi:hypothetical protein
MFWKLSCKAYHRNLINYLPEIDGLRPILYIFRKNIQNLSGKLSGKTEKHNIGIDTRQVAKHDQAEFQPATQMDLE